jgi:hypothetical protein
MRVPKSTLLSIRSEYMVIMPSSDPMTTHIPYTRIESEKISEVANKARTANLIIRSMSITPMEQTEIN